MHSNGIPDANCCELPSKTECKNTDKFLNKFRTAPERLV